MAPAGTQLRDRPLVSVVIPAHNAAATIGETLASVVAQSYAQIEVLVVVDDDGSPDETAGVVEQFGSGVQLLCNPHPGLAHARNVGWRRARGELIALLDADDLWLPGKVERQVAVMTAHPDVDLTYPAVMNGVEDGEVKAPYPSSPDMDLTESLLMSPGAMFASQSTIMIRREALERVGGYDPNPKFRGVEDLDLHLRLSLASRFFPQDEVLAIYRPTAMGMSVNVAGLANGTFAVLQKFFALPEAQRYTSMRRRAQSKFATVFAGMFFQAGDVRCATLWALRALYWDIRSFGAVAGLPARAARRAVAARAASAGGR